jgi:hypothetical protein
MRNTATRTIGSAPAARTISQPAQFALGLLLLTLFSVSLRAQDIFKPPPPVTYTEKFEAYGGINVANGQAGQNLPKRYNMGGFEGQFTYWLTPKIGAVGDFRWQSGTTPVLPQAQVLGIQTRPRVTQVLGMGGISYRGPSGQKIGTSVHALAGITYGIYNHSTLNYSPTVAGLYPNGSSPMGAAGVSIDFNRSARLAIRLQPDIIFEHFGTETRIFAALSGGVVYRFGNR